MSCLVRVGWMGFYFILTTVLIYQEGKWWACPLGQDFCFLLEYFYSLAQRIKFIFVHQWLLSTYRRSSALFQHIQPSYSLEACRNWWGSITIACLLNTSLSFLSCKQYSSLNTRTRKSFWRKKIGPKHPCKSLVWEKNLFAYQSPHPQYFIQKIWS